MNANTYQGHLPNGNPVQAHSAAHWYQRHGLVLVIQIAKNGRKLYSAEKAGKVIASSWLSGDAAIAAATAQLEAKGIH
jgi:ABC-type nitrate/sulfonate/bicarbonate transport system substrate-binding protein